MLGFSVMSRVPVFENVIFAKIKNWAPGGSEEDKGQADYEFTDSSDTADITGSILAKSVGKSVRKHKVMLDIDHEASLIPSSTPGHYHLYIDVDVYEDEYFDMLRFMAAAGVLQKGYVNASIKRGFTALRLPWVRKDDEDKGRY